MNKTLEYHEKKNVVVQSQSHPEQVCPVFIFLAFFLFLKNKMTPTEHTCHIQSSYIFSGYHMSAPYLLECPGHLEVVPLIRLTVV